MTNRYLQNYYANQKDHKWLRGSRKPMAPYCILHVTNKLPFVEDYWFRFYFDRPAASKFYWKMHKHPLDRK